MPRDGLWLTTSLFGLGHLCRSTALKRKPVSNQQCHVFGASGLPGSLLAEEPPNSESTTGQSCQEKAQLSAEAPSVEPTCCVYLSRVQINSSPFPPPNTPPPPDPHEAESLHLPVSV